MLEHDLEERLHGLAERLVDAVLASGDDLELSAVVLSVRVRRPAADGLAATGQTFTVPYAGGELDRELDRFDRLYVADMLAGAAADLLVPPPPADMPSLDNVLGYDPHAEPPTG